MFSKFLLVGFLGQALTCGVAMADSPLFPYAAADAAFATASVPQLSLLVGKWDLIGLAENPDVTSDIIGYWPDGKFQMSGYAGYFYQQPTITSTTDAFGNPSVTWDEQRFGAETGDLYSEYLSVGSMGTTGLLLTAQATDADCADAMECRMVSAQSMLLCRMMITDTRQSCRRDSADNTQVIYMAYKQLNPAP